MKNWFTSFFGAAFSILLANAVAAQWSGVSELWIIVAWAALASHVLAYAGMCLFIWAVVAGSLSAISGARKK